MRPVQQKIYDILEEIHKIDQIRSHFEDTEKQLKKAYIELETLNKKLEKELKDVEQLESLSMKALFHQILGSKEEQIEKERQEYLQASLKYNEFLKTVQVLEYEKELLGKKLSDSSKLKQELEKLKSQRENEILKSDPVLTEKLSQISHNMDDFFLFKRNVETAISTGGKSRDLLNSIIGELQKARQWGNWDMMGRDRMTGYFKYGAIDRAKNLSFQAKQALHRFQQDLLEIGGKTISFSFNLDHFSRFTDIFFDNLISDWVVQQKIVNAMSNVRSVRDKVIEINKSLENEVNKIIGHLQSLENEKETILLS